MKIRIIFILILLASASCISRKRVIPEDQRLLPAKTLSRADLLRSLQEKGKEIRTLRGPMVFELSSGAGQTDFVRDYRQTRGGVVIERPAHIRMQVLAPLALAKLADMVSDGLQYRVWVPIKNTFYVGDAKAPPKDKNSILNVRPQVIMDALFVDVDGYLNDPQMLCTLEETTLGRRRFYVFSFINVPARDLVQKLWIDRTDLQVSRKQVFTAGGKVEMDVEYSDYQSQGAVTFPQAIFIDRPVEAWTLKMTFQKPTLNESVVEDDFVLERPAGSELVELGSAADVTGAKP